ncbi:sugar transferase [Anaerorudis cellulosivorans]|jgi:lipopolysaccharide/colanic/teichoic acid biosynthesis glycosyltransferase|uniref:sugar transferase n=1 Tax=Anaerorudis cellulosivorans TaxID=3397862 RepID=UPI00221F32CA|nr:sugar transferase [Seramator thermalis]MCW1735263.1 sugar transferase [Seramator thermalis]
MIRFFDILFSSLGVVVLSPLFLVLAVWIKVDSKGPVFYKQLRVGKNDEDFRLYKFRTMVVNADKKGLITVGECDPRVTRAGCFLRKYKLDELPQLVNVLRGNMSLVGPRPEVRKYVEMYTPEQRKVLSVKPGLTDYASIHYIDENEVLAKSDDPEKTYVEVIIPEKIRYNMKYIENRSVKEYFKIIFMTLGKIVK